VAPPQGNINLDPQASAENTLQNSLSHQPFYFVMTVSPLQGYNPTGKNLLKVSVILLTLSMFCWLGTNHCFKPVG